MAMTVKYRVSETYFGTKDGRTTFPVPAGTETIEKVMVEGRGELRPGIDYKVARPRHKPFAPETFTLKMAPAAGANIHVIGIIWEKGTKKARRRK